MSDSLNINLPDPTKAGEINLKIIGGISKIEYIATQLMAAIIQARKGNYVVDDVVNSSFHMARKLIEHCEKLKG